MQLDQKLINSFETGLNPLKPEDSKISARIVGYGEMSTIFLIGDDSSIAYKRMPLFSSQKQAGDYLAVYNEYCELLTQTGISLPESGTCIVDLPDRPVILYIAQEMVPPERFGHRLIHTQNLKTNERMVRLIVDHSQKLWRFCAEHNPELEIAVDGQLSNWVHMDDGKDTLYYIDTSTPFIKKKGVHQLDPQVVLKTIPGLLRSFIKDKTVKEVLDRYYDPRKNMIDLVANLFKEQKPDLIAPFIDIINNKLPDGIAPLTFKDVKSYYREDKAIWALFLRLRRIDRWVTSKIRRKRYEYILPGKIKR
ncbi:hypothetical protein KJ966_29190 [bacterium]|nr:hypothetical protein [bacterium]